MQGIHVNYVGRVTRDCEMRFIPSGTAVSSFNMAVNEGYGDNQKTHWVKVTAWSKLAEIANEIAKKGTLIQVSGKIQTENGNPHAWIKDGVAMAQLEVRAEELTSYSSKNNQTDEENIPF